MADNERLLTFMEHLEEFRSRLIKCIVGLVLATIIGYFVANPILSFLLFPLRQVPPTKSGDLIQIEIKKNGQLFLKEPLGENGIEKIDRHRIEFFDEENNNWVDLNKDRLLRSRILPEPLELNLYIEQIPVEIPES